MPPPFEPPHTKIYSTEEVFKADGSITAWGNSLYGGTDAPSGRVYTKIDLTAEVFKADGSIASYQRAHLCLHNPNHPTP
jgi:hypothetical protein